MTSIVSYSEVADYFSSASSKTITGLSWQVDDVIVVVTTEGGYGGFPSPTVSNANLTFHTDSNLNTLSSVSMSVIQSAKATSAQTNQTLTITIPFALTFGASAWVIRGGDHVSVLAHNRTAAGTVSATVPAGATLIWASPDWDENNLNDTPKTGSGTVTERRDTNGAGYDQYIADWENVTAGTYDFGYSATTGDNNLLAIVRHPNVVATDDFNRANSSSLGSNWQSGSGVLTGTISSNTLTFTGDEYGHIEWAGAGSFSNDQWAELTVTADATNMSVGPVVRSTTGDNYYAARWDANVGEYQIWGYGYDLGSSPAPTSGTKTLRIEAIGTSIKMYADGVEVVAITDSTHTSGLPGITANTYYTSSNIVCDNFSAGDWVAAGTLFAEDWTGTDAAAWPAPWGNYYESDAAITNTIQSNKGRQVRPGGYTQSQIFTTGLNFSDFDATYKVQVDSAAEQYPGFFFRAGGTYSTSGGVPLSYAVTLAPSQNEVRLVERDSAGSGTDLVVFPDAGINNATQRWFRVQAIGSAIKVKWWDVGSGEPGTWQIETTDSTYTTGLIAFAGFSGASGTRTVEYDDLTVMAITAKSTTGTSSLALAASGTVVKTLAGENKTTTGAGSLAFASPGTATPKHVVTGAGSLAFASPGTDVKVGVVTGTSPLVLDASGVAAKNTAPGTITDLAATAGDTQVVLTWTAPPDGGDAITDYVVEYRVAP